MSRRPFCTSKECIVIGTVLMFGLFLTLSSGVFTPPPSSEASDYFANCLKEKGVTMYGTFWSDTVEKQKSIFGKAFKNVNYVECDQREDAAKVEECFEKKITTFPTWEIPGSGFMPGVQSLEVLSYASGCGL